MTPQFHRFAVEELFGRASYFAPTYGNTLMGLAVHKPRDPKDNYAIIYYPPAPRAVLEVVDPDEPDRRGRLRRDRPRALTTLTKEFFMPRFLERDEAEREPPCRAYPWDGVRNVRPFSELSSPPSSRGCTDAPPAHPAPRRGLPQRRGARRAALPDGEPVSSSAPANAGLIRRDLLPRRQAGCARRSRRFTARELVALCGRAPRLFMTATLPLGDTSRRRPRTT